MSFILRGFKGAPKVARKTGLTACALALAFLSGCAGKAFRDLPLIGGGGVDSASDEALAAVRTCLFTGDKRKGVVSLVHRHLPDILQYRFGDDHIELEEDSTPSLSFIQDIDGEEGGRRLLIAGTYRLSVRIRAKGGERIRTLVVTADRDPEFHQTLSFQVEESSVFKTKGTWAVRSREDWKLTGQFPVFEGDSGDVRLVVLETSGGIQRVVLRKFRVPASVPKPIQPSVPVDFTEYARCVKRLLP
ncbi:MAG: hypothetical protein NDJ89_05435 [Oligoflexia bacterium]|nr:hypothetical protein [Oligoflexia bacterium]